MLVKVSNRFSREPRRLVVAPSCRDLSVSLATAAAMTRAVLTAPYPSQVVFKSEGQPHLTARFE